MKHSRRLVALAVAPVLAAALASCDGAPTSPGAGPADQRRAGHQTAGPQATHETPATATATAIVHIELGHCFLEPVVFDGQQWNLPLSRQFGWGGGQPERWRGTGTMTRLGPGSAGYVDRGGATFTFYPLDDPAVARIDDEVCA